MRQIYSTPDGAPIYTMVGRGAAINPKSGYRPRIVTPAVDAEWQAGAFPGAPGAALNRSRPIPGIPDHDHEGADFERFAPKEEEERPGRLRLSEAKYGNLAYPGAQLWGTPAAAAVTPLERRAFFSSTGPTDMHSVYDPAATVPLNTNLGISLTPLRPTTYLDGYRAADAEDPDGVLDRRTYSRWDPSLARDNVSAEARGAGREPWRVRGGRTDPRASVPYREEEAPSSPNYETDTGVRASTDAVYGSMGERYDTKPKPKPASKSPPPPVQKQEREREREREPDPLLAGADGDPRLTMYGDAARAYQDDMLGNVQYYYRDVDPYQRPNFTIRSTVDHVDFTDPMGTTTPEYHQAYSMEDMRGIAEEAFHRDQLLYREGLMADIMLKMNQRSWQTRMAPLRRDAFRRT